MTAETLGRIQRIEATIPNDSGYWEAEYRDRTLSALAEYGIDDGMAWHDWLMFSNVQSANCLMVDQWEVARFRVWRRTRNPDDAWS